MSTEIADLEAELEQYTRELNDVRQRLIENPHSQDLLDLRANLEQFVELQTTAINDLKALLVPPKPPARSPSPPPPPPPPDSGPGYESSPRGRSLNADGDGAKTSSSRSTPPAFKVNDLVLAKWLAGDKGFYEARITAVSGKSTDPVYTVAFVVDNSVGSVRKHEIRPVEDVSKTKGGHTHSTFADGAPPPTQDRQHSESTPNPTLGQSSQHHRPTESFNKHPPEKPSSPVTSSNPHHKITGSDPSQKVTRTIRNKRELEQGKSNWQKFTQSKKAKVGIKKDSIFRTGDSVTARVGFTGSGKTMTKDPTRTRHTYEYVEDDY